eukprot:scaffold702908_cov145-Attheya_sp.AAC.1
MPVMSKPLLTLKADVIYSSTHCKPWDLLKHIGDGRHKTSSEGNPSCYSAHDKELTTSNVEIDLNHVCHEEILNLVDVSHLTTFADCYIFVHDWTMERTQTTIIECIKRCKALFLEDTPMIIIGINCHNCVSSPSPFASLPETMQIAEFNFDSEHCMSVKESVLPYLVHEVLSKTEEMRGIGEANLPYKALIPKSTDSILEAIFLPINETIDLGRKEMVKKGARGNRIGKAHMTVCHSDKGEVLIKSLRANAVIVNNPSSKALILVHQYADDQILVLEDWAEVCLLVGTTNTREEEERHTYVLFTGDAAIDAVSKVKYQAGFSLLDDLRSKEAELGSLLLIIRKSLTEAKEAKMELKILKESVAKSEASAGILQHISNDEGGFYSSDEDDFNDATQRDPVLDREFDSLNL